MQILYLKHQLIPDNSIYVKIIEFRHKLLGLFVCFCSSEMFCDFSIALCCFSNENNTERTDKYQVKIHENLFGNHLNISNSIKIR